MFDLNNELAVVIGGTGVLGGEIARGLAKVGATVAVVGRNRERGEACVKAITDLQGTADFFPCDVSMQRPVQNCYDAVERHYGRIPSVLVNAAGGNDSAATVTDKLSFEGITFDGWNTLQNMNVYSVLFPCQIFGAAMKRSGKGSIINIASVSAHIPLSRVVAYSAAKAQVLSLTQFLAREWGKAGVRVNSITPGFFPAEQNRKLLFNEDGSPTDRTKAIWAHTAMNRFGEAKELVGAAVFLASSQASSFVTGTDIRVDGGFLSQTI
jgi:NAD(P)-dependent dehydrogenase (short-subunit alcohol dehydrogenase family)